MYPQRATEIILPQRMTNGSAMCSMGIKKGAERLH